MIKDKIQQIKPPVETDKTIIVPEKVSEDPLANMYQAVKRTILTLREDH